MRDFVVRPEPLLSPVQVAERELIDVLSQTNSEQGSLITFRGMPGSGVDRVLQTALKHAREHGWLDFFVALVPWEREVPYSALERVCLKMSGLNHLLAELHPEHDPVALGRKVLAALELHFEHDERRLLMVFDHLEYCDPLSAIVFRYIVMRAVAKGAYFVLGDSLALPVDLGDELRQVVYTEPEAHLFVLPELSASEVVTVIGQRAGTGIAVGEGERVRKLTGGRFDAVIAYLNSVSQEHLADLAAIRTLPSVTAARMPGSPVLRLEALSEPTRVAAELCALQPDGVSMQTLKLVSNRLGVPFSLDAAVDDDTVVMNSLTGMLHLYDPLNAPDVIERTEVGRLRAMHAALADLTFGQESRIQALLAMSTVDDDTVNRILDTSAELESNGHAQDALEFLDVAIERTRDCAEWEFAYRQFLRMFGHVFIRQSSPVQYQERISDFAVYAESDTEFAFMYLCLRTVKAHGRLEARDLRLEYMAAPPESIDHEFMQAEVSRLELLSALQTGPAAVPEAMAEAQRRYGALVGRKPESSDLQWIDARGRLLSLGTLAISFAMVSGDVQNGRVKAREFANQAAEFPKESPDALDALTATGIVLSSLGHIGEAREIIEEARSRMTCATDAALIKGQFDVLDLDLAQRLGDLDAMRSRIDSALVRAFDGMDMPTRIALPAFKAWLLALEGDLDQSRRYLTIAKQADRYRYPGYALDMLAIAEAEILRVGEGPAAALAVLDEAASLPRNQSSRRIVGLQIEMCAVIGEHQRIHELWAKLQAIQNSLDIDDDEDFSWVEGIVIAVQGDLATARDIFLKGASESSSNFTVGKCHLALANFCARQRGQQESRTEHFERARAAFESIGAMNYANDAMVQQRNVASRNQERIAALTRRERQVAHLAARGWRNKEIARELNIGVATVAFHMSNALKKLGIAKRAELSSLLD